MKWQRRAAAAVGVLLLSWLAAWLAVPPLLKWQAQLRLSEWLGRSVTIGEVRFQPWRLELTLDDLVIGAASAGAATTGAATTGAAATGATTPPASAEPLLRVARLRGNFAFWPLWRGVPVVEALDIDAARLHVARLSEGHYDVDDLIARLGGQAAAPAGGEPAGFALYNLRVRDAQVLFDDRPAQRVHRLEALQLALPFLSNLPAQVEVTVAPHLAFKLNGVAFDSGAQATPFAPTPHGVLKLAFSELDLGPYLVYLPSALPVRLTRGTLSTDLALEFTHAAGSAPRVALSGWVAARDLALSHPDGAPLLAWRQMRLGLREVQPLARRVALEALRIEGARLQLTRDAAGRLRLPPLADGRPAPATRADGAASGSGPAASATGAASAPSPAASPWQLSLATLELAGAQLRWNDAAVQPAAALALDDLALRASQLQWPMTQPATVSLAATLRPQADAAAAAGRLSVEGSASDHDATLTLGVDALALDALAPYLAQAVLPRVEGRLSAQGRLAWAADPAAPKLQFALDRATLDELRVRPGGGRAAPDGATLRRLSLADAQLDLTARTATLGRVALAQPTLLLARDAQGRFNVADWLRAAPAGDRAEEPAAPARSQTPEWRVHLRELQLDGGRLQLADSFVRRERSDQPLRSELQQLRLTLQDLRWAGEQPAPAARVQLSARVSRPASARDKAPAAGTVEWKGEAGHRPLLAAGSVRIVRLPVHLFTAYLGERLPLRVVRAEAGWTGRFSVREQRAGWAVAATGDVLLGDVHTTTWPDPDNPATLATGADELLSWQSLALNRVSFTMQPGARPQLDVGAAALTDFYSRLVVTEQGHFNLQDVGAHAAAPAPAAAASTPEAVAAAPAAAPPPAAAAASAVPSGLPLDIRIGGTTLSNGHIDFSDHFVRPNYSAALTELNGELGPLRSTSREMATLQLRGRAAGTALLDIRGQINPTVQPPALDIQARASDLELAPLTPYAGKYAGYAIERGKLSLDVAYKIEPDGRLQARNQLVLNQLTFGERIESPSATKLPVLLAVALLKDRNGVIDINLPISGSLNDPKFSVGGIIVRLIVNLIAKALTAPFTLLMGGGGPDLSSVEFQPGTALLATSGASAVEKVAKALNDRPALKMTVTGQADLAAEREAYQRAAIESRLLAERRREGLRAGAAASAPVTLSPDDRTRLLKTLYRQTELPDKPRNALGLAKDLPEPQMEALLRRHVPVTDETMRELALQRGLAVRDALIAAGLASERLFLAAPRLHTTAQDEPAWVPQAQLSLSVK